MKDIPKYKANIISRLNKQIEKGISKYGQPLEQNPAGIFERFEHLAEELTDALEYIEWAKEELREIMLDAGIEVDKGKEKISALDTEF